MLWLIFINSFSYLINTSWSSESWSYASWHISVGCIFFFFYGVILVYNGKRIAVVMPAYNAETKICGVIQRTPKIYDVYIVVEDKSKDGTLQVLKTINGIVLIEHARNMGYGGAQKTLYREALKYNVDYAVLLHDDGQYLPEEMPKLLDNAIANNSDIVLGSRVLGGKMKDGKVPIYKYYGNIFLTLLENIAFGTSISEFHSGYRVYSKNAMKRINWDALTNKYYFDSDIILAALEKKLKITEEPISVHYWENITAANPFSYGLEILYLIGKHTIKRIKKLVFRV